MNFVAYVFIGIIAAFMLWQLIPLLRARQMRGRSAPNISGLLDDKQQVSSRLLIYFWSPQCGMCKGMSNIIDELKETHDNILKIDVVPNMEIAAGFGIMGTPSLALVNAGKIEKMMVGAKTKSQITKILDCRHNKES